MCHLRMIMKNIRRCTIENHVTRLVTDESLYIAVHIAGAFEFMNVFLPTR